MTDNAAPEIGGSLVAAGISAAAGDIVSAAAGVGGLLVSFGMRLDAKRRAQAEQALSEAADQLGGIDRLSTLIGDDPARLELMTRVVQASADSTIEEKITALAAVLAAGVRDDRTDEALILAAALADLEAPHVQVLQALAHGGGAWTRGRIVDEVPGVARVVNPVLATLLRHGLVLDGTTIRNVFGAPDAPEKEDAARLVTPSLGLEILALLGDKGVGPPSLFR